MIVPPTQETMTITCTQTYNKIMAILNTSKRNRKAWVLMLNVWKTDFGKYIWTTDHTRRGCVKTMMHMQVRSLLYASQRNYVLLMRVPARHLHLEIYRDQTHLMRIETMTSLPSTPIEC